MWMFPKIGVPQNGWFIMKNPIKMDDLGGKPTIFGNIRVCICLTVSSRGHPKAFQKPNLGDLTLEEKNEKVERCQTGSK